MAARYLVRELDQRFGLDGLHLVDSRTGRNTHSSRWPTCYGNRCTAWLAGYEDLNDASRLSADTTFRLIGSKKVWERGAALTSTLHWFEADLLARDENLSGLAKLNVSALDFAEVDTGGKESLCS